MSGKLSERRRRFEEEQAEDYAAAIRNSGWITPSWQALNEQIIEEFGRAGLLRIKRRAWQIIEGSPALSQQSEKPNPENDDPTDWYQEQS